MDLRGIKLDINCLRIYFLMGNNMWTATVNLRKKAAVNADLNEIDIDLQFVVLNKKFQLRLKNHNLIGAKGQTLSVDF
uniref:Uncharacterized protein n=1 Tax=Romanomermis culicivorax TaxID=13658 RepID=A0A915I509_ROMCU